MMVVLIIVVVIAAFLGFSATKPGDFAIRRSTTIKAGPEKIQPLIADFHKWGGWSPWEKIDADLKRTYEGSPSGVGAIYGWEGKKAGTGRMEITGATPTEVKIDLDFLKPMKASNKTVFAMEPSGGETKLTWTMSGQQPFMAKVMSTFFSMDKLVGKDFEAGLAGLKTLAEG